MDKKHLIFFVSAAICCALITVVAAAGTDRTAETIHRDQTDSFSVFFQTEAGTYLSAQMDSGENTVVISPADFPTPEYTVNINTASIYELDALLPGIGEKKAAAIAEYRDIVGSFHSVDELVEVEGISRSLMERLRPYCRVSDTDSVGE